MDSNDVFIRNGRIGPILLRNYNQQTGTSLTSQNCSFSVRVGAEGFGAVELRVGGNVRAMMTMSDLRKQMPDGVFNAHEKSFFRGLGVSLQYLR